MKMFCAIFRNGVIAGMKNIENSFGYHLIDAVNAKRNVNYYGLDGDGLIKRIENCFLNEKESSSEELITKIQEYTYTCADLNNAVLNFYYSYHCKFKKKIAFNSYARKNSGMYGYTSDESASARARKLKKEIADSKNELSMYFKDIFEEMGQTHRGTVPQCDTDILIQSVFSYYKGPFYIRESYTGKLLDKFLKDFDKVLCMDDKLKRHINSYVFERIYHIRFISTLISIYKELSIFLDKLEINDVNVVYRGNNCEYFDASAMLSEIKRYIFAHNCTLQTAQKDFKIKLREFVLNLCEFATIPDVYTREEHMRTFTYNNVCKIMDEQKYIDELRKTVAVHTRQAYIDSEIFYYGYMLWIIRKLEVSGEYNTDYIWNHLFDKSFTQECIDREINDMEKLIRNDSFDIELKGLSESFFGYDDILNDIFQKVLFSVRVFEVNEKIMQSPIANDEFNRDYKKLVEKAMQADVTFNSLYNFTVF